MTWNAANLARGVKELSLSHLLNINNVDVAIITEAELPTMMATTFSVDGYTPFLPVVGPTEKTRVLALVKSVLAVRMGARLRLDLMTLSVQTLWLELNQPNGNRLVIGGVYRQWTSSSMSTSSCQSGLAMEREQLDIILNQVKLASRTAKAIIVLGDFNLDAHRSNDTPLTPGGPSCTAWSREWRQPALTMCPRPPPGGRMAGLLVATMSPASTMSTARGLMLASRCSRMQPLITVPSLRGSKP
jgi:hypothetical protein